MSDKAREGQAKDASGFVWVETRGEWVEFICVIEKRRSTAALQNAKRQRTSNHGHFRKQRPGYRFMACQGRWVAK